MRLNRIIPGYKATEDGRIFSTNSNWRGYGERELHQTPNSDGYPSVRLMIDGKRKRMAVHTLVAYEFLGTRISTQEELRHLNGTKTDNRVENLAWGSRKENAEDRESHGRTSRGTAHSQAILKGLAIAKAEGRE